MRLNTVPPPVYTVPDTVPVQGLEGVRPVDPIKEDESRRPPRPPPAEVPETSPEPIAETLDERRQDAARRSEDRRKRQIPVLIDTRSGRDRRRTGRREDDPPAGSIDLKA